MIKGTKIKWPSLNNVDSLFDFTDVDSGGVLYEQPFCLLKNVYIGLFFGKNYKITLQQWFWWCVFCCHFFFSICSRFVNP